MDLLPPEPKHAPKPKQKTPKQLAIDTIKGMFLEDMEPSSNEIGKHIPMKEKTKDLMKSQLASLCKAQVIKTRESYQKIKKAKTVVKQVSESFAEISQKIQDDKGSIKLYDLIKDINFCFENIKKTRDSLNKICKFKDEADDMKKDLEDIRRDSGDEHPWLLEIYEQMEMYDQLRYQLEEDSKDNRNLQKAFQSFLVDIEMFSSEIISLTLMPFNNFMAVVKFFPEKIVRSVRIVERQEKKERDGLVPEKYKRQMKTKLFAYFDKYINNLFDTKVGHDLNNISQSLEILGKEIDNLAFIENKLSVCFPPSYEVLEYFANNYQDKIKAKVKYWLDSNISAQLCIEIGLFIDKKYPGVFKNYSTILKPKVYSFEEEKNKVIESVVTGVKTKMNQFSNQLVVLEFSADSFKKQPIDKSKERNIQYSQAPNDLFSMVHQLFKNITDSGLDFLIMEVFSSIRSALITFNSTFRVILEEKTPKKGEFDYRKYCAFLNNCNLIKVNIDDFAATAFTNIAQKTEAQQKKIKRELNEVKSEYDSLADYVIALMRDNMQQVVEPAYATLFSNNWFSTAEGVYSQQGILDACTTLKSFFGPIRFFSLPLYYGRILVESYNIVCRKYVDNMLKGMIQKKTLNFTEDGLKIIEKDFEEIHETFFTDLQMEKEIENGKTNLTVSKVNFDLVEDDEDEEENEKQAGLRFTVMDEPIQIMKLALFSMNSPEAMKKVFLRMMDLVPDIPRNVFIEFVSKNNTLEKQRKSDMLDLIPNLYTDYENSEDYEMHKSSNQWGRSIFHQFKIVLQKKVPAAANLIPGIHPPHTKSMSNIGLITAAAGQKNTSPSPAVKLLKAGEVPPPPPPPPSMEGFKKFVKSTSPIGGSDKRPMTPPPALKIDKPADSGSSTSKSKFGASESSQNKPKPPTEISLGGGTVTQDGDVIVEIGASDLFAGLGLGKDSF